MVVTSLLTEAVKVFDELKQDSLDEVSIHDMDGREIDIDLLRSVLRKEAPEGK